MGTAVGWRGRMLTGRTKIGSEAWDNLPCQTEMTSACRDLKDTVRVGGRTVVAIGGRMLMISIVSMRLGKLIEKMMYLMGRGID